MVKPETTYCDMLHIIYVVLILLYSRAPLTLYFNSTTFFLQNYNEWNAQSFAFTVITILIQVLKLHEGAVGAYIALVEIATMSRAPSGKLPKGEACYHRKQRGSIPLIAA